MAAEVLTQKAASFTNGFNKKNELQVETDWVSQDFIQLCDGECAGSYELKALSHETLLDRFPYLWVSQ